MGNRLYLLEKASKLCKNSFGIDNLICSQFYSRAFANCTDANYRQFIIREKSGFSKSIKFLTEQANAGAFNFKATIDASTKILNFLEAELKRYDKCS